ncbi:type II toxin-antitoxin system RelE/ParE family toxin [Chitinophaga barathri]|uniref:Type II toxin-antitoxin system RelE/ParE family toxin n=1 Tax=Chitinophaga barathri TaxID=1647451 RepID=A0A3N4MDI9_9BACT|nr:type II toxin-antitoxin system RelE/ParE family toxin [Chitinophaga barathri]
MVISKKIIVWSPEAKRQIKEAYKYISKDSPKNAIRVRSDIVTLTRMLSPNPEHYPVDKYKLNNDGTFRAFEKHSYRISYRILDKEIRILKVRHTKMEPLPH